MALPDRPPLLPPAAEPRGQCPRAPRAVAATCQRPASPGAPSCPYLSRRCAPGAGGPCSSTTTGRSGSGRGGSGLRAARARLAAGRAPRTCGLRPPPGRPARLAAPRGAGPRRPSAPGGCRPGARGGAGAEGCAAGRVATPRQRGGRGGWTSGAAKPAGVGAAGGGRGQKSLHRKEPPTAGSCSRAKAAGPRAGPPRVPEDLPGCSSPKPQALPFTGWQPEGSSGRALVTQQVGL